MLQEISITNIALIKQLIIEFSGGFNVLTGETGAGKSIIIGAVCLLIGDRVTKEIIKTGEEKAVVEGIFNVRTGHRVGEFLKKHGIDHEDDGTMIITREITNTGKNTCRINGRYVTLSILKQVGETLIDVHGQHEHQSLLRVNNHIQLLDMFGSEKLLLIKAEVSKLYKQYKEIEKEIEKLSGDGMEIERSIDLLQFQAEEIDKANLKNHEESSLREQHALLSNAEKLINALSYSYEILYGGGNKGNSITEEIGSALSSIDSVKKYNKHLEKMYNNLESVILQIEDICFELREFRDNIGLNHEMLNEIESRLDLISNLKRKYGSTIDEIIKYRDEIGRQLDFHLNSSDRLKQCNALLAKVFSSLMDNCSQLSLARKHIAEMLEKQITKELKDLGMNKARFRINIISPESSEIENNRSILTEKGYDKVEFLISTNPGEDLKPLAKIISGGEVSRIMLAIKSVLAGIDDMPSMIFDEIDTGVSGKIAQVVGEKINSLSLNHQIICVTHLPQIACMADAHYSISKTISEANTMVIVEKLDYNKRVIEIAELLGGKKVTDVSKKLAINMLQTMNKN